MPLAHSALAFGTAAIMVFLPLVVQGQSELCSDAEIGIRSGNATDFFDGGEVPAGLYTAAYVQGAWRGCPTCNWRVQGTLGPETRNQLWAILLTDAQDRVYGMLPGSMDEYLTQAMAQEGSQGMASTFAWPGGRMSAKLVDSIHSDNVPGLPGPTWRICRQGDLPLPGPPGCGTVVALATAGSPVDAFEGRSMEPGHFRATYRGGAIRFARDNGWEVQGRAGAGFFLEDARNAPILLLPGIPGPYESQKAAEAASQSLSREFFWPGGVMRVRLADSVYTDNSPGSPNPTWEICTVPGEPESTSTPNGPTRPAPSQVWLPLAVVALAGAAARRQM